jgi:hypothetical protein
MTVCLEDPRKFSISIQRSESDAIDERWYQHYFVIRNLLFDFVDDLIDVFVMIVLQVRV